MGGSLTAGAECNENGKTLKMCAWPMRFANWFRSQYPHIRLHLYNQGLGGTPTQAAIPMIAHWPKADIVLLDYVVNDINDAVGNLAPAHLAFIDQFRQIQPDAALFYVSSCASKYCATMRDLIIWISTTQSVPMISFYDVIQCSAYLSQDHGKLESEVWPKTTPTHFHAHPPWQTHDLIAQTLAYVFFKNIVQKQYNESYRLYDKSELTKFQTCSHPITHYSAHGKTDNSAVQMDKWALKEDRKGKPGWISEAFGSSIKFPMSFGSHPALTFSYLKSYENLGKVQMLLNGVTYHLDGLYTKEELVNSGKVSQTHVQFFDLNKNIYGKVVNSDADWTGFGVLPNSSKMVEFRVVPDKNAASSKFKIISISSC